MLQSALTECMDNHSERIARLEENSKESSRRLDRIESKLDKLGWLIIMVIVEVPITVIL